jgi:hypothetical protein
MIEPYVKVCEAWHLREIYPTVKDIGWQLDAIIENLSSKGPPAEVLEWVKLHIQDIRDSYELHGWSVDPTLYDIAYGNMLYLGSPDPNRNLSYSTPLSYCFTIQVGIAKSEGKRSSQEILNSIRKMNKKAKLLNYEQKVF